MLDHQKKPDIDCSGRTNLCSNYVRSKVVQFSVTSSTEHVCHFPYLGSFWFRVKGYNTREDNMDPIQSFKAHFRNDVLPELNANQTRYICTLTVTS